MSKNPIIVFEGIEGTGKSHHIYNVAKLLKKIIENLFKLGNLVEVKILKK